MPAQATAKDDVTDSNSPLLKERHVYKPFLYPWCYEAWLTQQPCLLDHRLGCPGFRLRIDLR